ncbi:MAG: hypothetical protein ACO3RX_00080 [Chthoniobacterales bacterium]
MTYRLAFLDQINTEGARDFVLRPDYFTGVPFVGTAGLSFMGSEYEGTRYPAGLLSISPVSRQVRAWRWQASHGTPDVTVDPTAIDPDSLRRGSVWELIALTRSESGLLWRCLLDRVRLKKDSGGWRYVLSFVDIAAMTARASPDTDDLTLFSYAGQTTTMTSNAGAAATTYNVASTADFFARSAPGTRGLLRGEPSSGSADPFLAGWTAKTATSFTVYAGGQYGTTKTGMSSGSTVVSLGYFEGHPARFAQEIYTGESPGASRSVADSGYLRLPPHMWNQPDSEARYAETSDLEYAFWTDAPVQMEAVADWLGIGGWFPTMCHGLVTCRTLPDVGAYWTTTVRPDPKHILRMSDLAVRGTGSAPIRLETDLYGSGEWQLEYLQTAVATQAGTALAPSTATAEKRAYPTLSEYRIDLDNSATEVSFHTYLSPSGIHAGSSYGLPLVMRTRRIETQRSAVHMPQNGPALYATTANNLELARRLSPYIVHAPQILTATFAGPHPEYTLGDPILFAEDWDLPAAVGGTIAGLQGMIAGTSMDVLGLTHTVTIWIPPQRSIPFAAAGAAVRDPQA